MLVVVLFDFRLERAPSGPILVHLDTDIDNYDISIKSKTRRIPSLRSRKMKHDGSFVCSSEFPVGPLKALYKISPGNH